MSEAELKSRKWDNTKLSLSVFFANKAAVVGLVITLIFVADALIVQFIPQIIGITNPGSLTYNFLNPAPSPPSMAHLFGTTYPGVDLFTSMVKAIRIDLFYSVLVVAIGAAVGSLIGVMSATVGGLMDEIVMRITDVFFSIPVPHTCFGRRLYSRQKPLEHVTCACNRVVASICEVHEKSDAKH